MGIFQKIFLLTIATIVICIGGFVGYMLLQDHAKISALNEHGKLVDAKVIEIQYKKSKRSGTESNFKAYISFETNDNKPIRTTIDLETSEAQLWKETNHTPKSIKVRYSVENPEIAIKDGYKGLPILLQCSVIALLLAGLYFFIWVLRRRA